MRDLIDRITISALGRAPTDADRKKLDMQLRSMPPELRDSPAAIWDLVVRTDQLRQFEEIVAETTRQGQERIHKDLQPRMEELLYTTISRIREKMPMNPVQASARLIKLAAIGALVLFVVAFGAGYSWAHMADRKDRERHHAATDVELTRCIDAAAGGFAFNARRYGRTEPMSLDPVHDDLRACGDEYADRRAGDHP